MNYDSKTVNRAFAIMLFDGLCCSCAAVVIPLLRSHYGLSYNFTGLLLALLSVGNLTSALICGFLPAKIGQKKTALIFSAGLACGYLLMSASGLPAMIALAFLLVGIGKGATMNNVIVVTGQTADKTKSTNLVNALFATGSLLSPVVYLALSRSSFWKLPLLALTASGLVVWLLFTSLQMKPAVGGKKGNSDGMEFLHESHFWLSVAFLFMQQCAEISVTGWLVTYFKDTGILSGIFSELTVTVVWGAMLIGRLIIAFVLPEGHKFRSLTLMSITSLIAYVALLFARSGAVALAVLFVFGICECGCYPTSIAKSSSSLSNASVGVMIPVAGIGAIVMPYVVGFAAEKMGIYAGMICPVFALIGMVLFAFLLRKHEKQMRD